MLKNNLSWINLNVGSGGGGGTGGVSDYNDLANRPIKSLQGTSQNPISLWNLSTGLYLLNGYINYDANNSREGVNLFVSLTAQMQNGQYVMSAFVPSWEAHYEYKKASANATDYAEHQMLKMLTQDEVLTMTNETPYTPTGDYNPSTKKYVDDSMNAVLEHLSELGVNEQDIQALITENRRRDIAIQALLNETADKNVTIEEETHTISLDYSIEDGMATVNKLEGSTLVNVSKQKEAINITKSYDVETGNYIHLESEQDGKCKTLFEGNTAVNRAYGERNVVAMPKIESVGNNNHTITNGLDGGKVEVENIKGNTLVNIAPKPTMPAGNGNQDSRVVITDNIVEITMESGFYTGVNFTSDCPHFKPDTTYTLVANIIENTMTQGRFALMESNDITALTDVSLPLGYKGMFIATTKSRTSYTLPRIQSMGNTECATGEKIKFWLMIFEGDLTQTPELIPTEYVEGLKSSFELEENKVDVKVVGKNKFDGEIELGYLDDNTGLNTSNSSCIRSKNYIKINPLKQYTISNDKGYNKIIVWYYDSNKTGIGAETIKSNLTSIPSNTKYIRFRTAASDVANDLTTKFQLEEGEVATEYEPYKEDSYQLLLNSPLLKDDEIRVQDGWLGHYHKMGKVVLDGNSNIKKSAYTGVADKYRWDVFGTNIANVSENSITTLCDTLKSITAVQSWYGTAEGICQNSSNNVLHIYLEDYAGGTSDDLNSLKQWLQANPTTVVYELANPYFEPLVKLDSLALDIYNTNSTISIDSAVPVQQSTVKNLSYRLQGHSSPYVLDYNADGEITTEIVDDRLRIYGNGAIVEDLMMFDGSEIPKSDYFQGLKSVFEEGLVTDESDPNYGKYALELKSFTSNHVLGGTKVVYLSSPLFKGDSIEVIDGKLVHVHKMGMVVFNGSEGWDLDVFNKVNTNTFYLRYVNIKGVSGTKVYCDRLPYVETSYSSYDDEGIKLGEIGVYINILKSKLSTQDMPGFKQWLSENPTVLVYQLVEPWNEVVSENIDDITIDTYANGYLGLNTSVYPSNIKFLAFEEELTYLYASTTYTVQFDSDGEGTIDIILGGASVLNKQVVKGKNNIQVTTPSTLADNKLIMGGYGNYKVSNVVVTNSTKEFDYFEGMKSTFEDTQNEDGTYNVEIVVYNAPVRFGKNNK